MTGVEPGCTMGASARMRVETKTEELRHVNYVVDMEDGRKVFLSVRKDSHPLRVESGGAASSTMGSSMDVMSAVDEAGTWLVAEIAAGRA